MPRWGLFNLAWGFGQLSLAGMAGSFIATETTAAFVRDPSLIQSWGLSLERSSHGHTSLFALIHIALGLSMPYARLPKNWQKWQTLGLCAGSFSMSVLLLVKAASLPRVEWDGLGLALGLGLGLSLLSLVSQALALAYRLIRP